ncbi:hypothetical protein HPB52_001223 [Rhipicephalus sanguineus]|uniref:Uncharacterized protein n=1 Tax=Rhipicephalus sanguineus TaxID=34632 RepID=A0A9D4PY68_RHISA|nr:hypothetical protein HPB52_001223 [Rhipicephalus sanguineus]
MASPKTVTGYDPASMQIVSMDTAQLEDLPPSEDELLDDMVRIWRRKQKTLASKDTGGVVQQQAAARSAHARHGNAASAALKGETHKSQWRPQQTPRIGRDELIVVLKPRTTLDLKETFVPGQAGAAVRNLIRECGEVELTVWPVWDQNVLVCGLNSVPAAERLLGDVIHLTGAADCRDKYRKPIKPRLPPTNTKRTSAPKEAPSTKVNKKKSASTAGKPGQVKTTDKAGTRTKTSTSNADDFPPLANAQTKVSGWVGAAPGPLSPSPTEVALQRQNAELRRHTENLAKKIRELEAKLARLTEPQAHGGPSEPMQQTEPVNLDDRASVVSDLSSDSQCTGSTSIGHVPIMEHRLENLERTIADMPSKILEGVRASFRELWQRELPHMVESITPAVTDSVLSIVQGRTGVQFRNSRSRSRSPRPDTRRRPVVSRQIIGSQEHIAAASSPETLVPPPEAPPLSGIGPAPNN